MNDLYLRLKTHWQQQNVALGDVVTQSEIETFETAHQLHIPDDFKAYLLNVNGMAHKGECEDNWHTFWPLNDLKSLAEDDMCSGQPAVADAAHFFIFADHCIRVWDFAVRFSPERRATTPVYFVAGPPRQIAETFEEFIERYLANDDSVIYPG